MSAVELICCLAPLALGLVCICREAVSNSRELRAQQPPAIDQAMQEALEEADRIGYAGPPVAPPRPQPRGIDVMMENAMQAARSRGELEHARLMCNANAANRDWFQRHVFVEVDARPKDLAEAYSRKVRGLPS